MRQPPTPQDFRSTLHGPALTARLGVWLGSAFLVCFVTGLISHVHQHPLPFLVIAPGPEWGYRVSQGLHVATGTACLPLLLAKLYSAYPRLFERPVLGGPLLALERLSIGVLVASALFEVVTGIVNVAQWYSVFGFGFIQAHFAFAWISIGALTVHIAVKLPVIRDALSSPLDEPAPDAPSGSVDPMDATGLDDVEASR